MSAVSAVMCYIGKEMSSLERLDASMNAWPHALELVRIGRGLSLTHACRLFECLAHWRRARTKMRLRVQNHACVYFLLEAAARLALMDWVHAGPEPAAERAALVRGPSRMVLTECEQAALALPFRPEPPEADLGVVAT